MLSVFLVSRSIPWFCLLVEFILPLWNHPTCGNSLSHSPICNWITKRKLAILVVRLGILGFFFCLFVRFCLVLFHFLFCFNSILSKKISLQWTTACFAFKSRVKNANVRILREIQGTISNQAKTSAVGVVWQGMSLVTSSDNKHKWLPLQMQVSSYPHRNSCRTWLSVHRLFLKLRFMHLGKEKNLPLQKTPTKQRENETTHSRCLNMDFFLWKQTSAITFAVFGLSCSYNQLQ